LAVAEKISVERGEKSNNNLKPKTSYWQIRWRDLGLEFRQKKTLKKSAKTTPILLILIPIFI